MICFGSRVRIVVQKLKQPCFWKSFSSCQKSQSFFIMEDRIENLKNLVKSYPDFPRPGILFRDIFPILQDPKAFGELRSIMGEYVKTKIAPFDIIVGLESRGFIFGSVLASELQLPFVPIRKPGKLPGEIASAQFVLEYGTDTFEIQKDAIKENQKILLVDDLLATGGSLVAASSLVEKVGGEVIGCFVVMELVDLLGREKLKPPTYSLIRF